MLTHIFEIDNYDATNFLTTAVGTMLLDSKVVVNEAGWL